MTVITVHTLVSPAELAHLRALRDEVAHAMDRVAEHERKGYRQIAVGTFDRVRAILDGETGP